MRRSFYLAVPFIAACLAFLPVFADGQAIASAAPLPEAPHQIDGVLYPPYDGEPDGTYNKNSVYVLVDFGAAYNAPPPAAPDTVTLLGTNGTAIARFFSVEKKCTFLCGDAGEECHYVGLYEISPPELERMGQPLAALSGTHSVGAYTPAPEPTIVKNWPEKTADAPFALPLYADNLSAEEAESHGTRLRFRTFDQKTSTLNLEWTVHSIGKINALEDKDCQRPGKTGDLVAISCPSVSVLLDHDAMTPLLISWPDYNSSKAHIEAAFNIGGDEYFLIKLGLKAQDAYGLLSRDGNRKWKALFRPRDYALLC